MEDWLTANAQGCSQSSVFYTVVIIKCVSDGNTFFQEALAWSQSMGKTLTGWERKAGRGDDMQDYTSSSTTDLYW